VSEKEEFFSSASFPSLPLSLSKKEKKSPELFLPPSVHSIGDHPSAYSDTYAAAVS